MDFFEAQASAKRRTGLLVGLFAAAVLAIIVGVYLVVLVSLGVGLEPGVGLDPVVFFVVALGTGILIGMGSLFRTAQLRRGGAAVASLMGGRRVSHDTRDPDEQRLVNVVEEMSIASGTPVPAIFVLDGESSINAFAAGHSIHDAAVAVTRGTLEKLDRDELQGVIAHEFSHILNGDMRLNVRLIGLLFGILLLAVVGRGILRGGMWSRRRSGNQAAVLGLALMALGYIGVLFGKLIKAAVSRQREFLADAAAVQFTRNPAGLAGALRKIGGHPRGGRMEDHHAEELSHLFFADGVGGAFTRMMATHPPLDERIRRVDRHGASEGAAQRVRRREPALEPEAAPAASDTGAVPGPGGMAGVLAGAAVLMGSVGSPRPEHVIHARELLERLPPEVREAAHRPAGAQALILALLGGESDVGRQAWEEAVRDLNLDGGEAPERLRPLLAELGPEARLPLLDLALPALQTLEPGEASALRAAVRRVIRADGQIRPFDFALSHILWRHLPGGVAEAEKGGREVKSLVPLRRAVEAVMSGVAWAGADGEDQAEQAFQAGLQLLPEKLAGELVLRRESAVGHEELDEALSRLERGSLDVRRQVLEVCAAVVFADREVRTAEVELLRAVAECLELPLPPMLGGRTVDGARGVG